MSVIKLSKAEARRLLLSQQGLIKKQPFGKGKKGLLATIQRLGYVQIDTISVIERAQHHTLWLRLPDYKKEQLHTLQAKDKTIFEYWSHAAAYLPMENYRFSLPRMQIVKEKDSHWYKREPKVMKFVLDRIKAEGPLLSRDFKPPKERKAGAWWDWKPSKRALEQLFHEGTLMIAHREKFQKVYDLRERVLPDNIDTSTPNMTEYCRHLILGRIKAQGLATAKEICYLRKIGKKELPNTLNALLENGEILEVVVEGLAGKYYTCSSVLDRLTKRRNPDLLQFLNPFDNAIIQRQRVRDFFDFNYKLEIYVPAHKRVYGYYCLAVLWGDRFVGHLDVKADRQAGVFRLIKFSPVDGFKADEQFRLAFDKRVRELANFNSVKFQNFVV